MASAARTEGEAFTDLRFDELALYAGLSDADHARGKMARLWGQCTSESTYYLSETAINHVLGPNGVTALVKARLGELQNDGSVRIKGTTGRIEWLGKLRKNARFGKKGGRPKNNPGGLGGGNPGGLPKQPQNETPIATALAPDLDPAPATSPGTLAPLASGSARAHDPTVPVPPPNPDAGVTERRAILQRVHELHREVYERTRVALNSDARPMTVVGDPSERALAKHLMETHVTGICSEDNCRHVLTIREAEAIEKKTVQFLGASVWNPVSFARAMAMTLDDVRAGSDLSVGRYEPPPASAYGNGEQIL